MSNLKVVGKSMYGTKYALNGALPFASIDTSNLKYGDVIQDNNGSGMIVYVNQCCSCEKKFFAGTLIFVAEECDDCYRSSIFYTVER